MRVGSSTHRVPWWLCSTAGHSTRVDADTLDPFEPITGAFALRCGVMKLPNPPTSHSEGHNPTGSRSEASRVYCCVANHYLRQSMRSSLEAPSVICL